MIELHQLPHLDFSVENISVRREKWAAGTVYDYLDTPRSRNLIHIITGGNRVCRFGGRDIPLHDGDVLLIPDETRYRTCLTEGSSGIGICFDLVSNGEKIRIRPDVYHAWSDRDGQFSALTRHFGEGTQELHPSQLRLRATVWMLLEKMTAELEDLSAMGGLLSPALRHMALHYREEVPISDYANLCGLSESHFRRKFSEGTGMTPVEYRDFLRFEEAERLRAQGVSVARIAEQVGFCDASYLRRMYKKRKGIHFREYQPPELT